MIDLHTHILPGLDDGSPDLDESVAFARAAVADGVSVMAATPHVRADFPTSADVMEESVAELQAVLDREVIPLTIVPGGEVDLQMVTELGADELRRFTLNGTGAYLLVESPYVGWPLDMEQRLFRIRLASITPILAHPERNPDVQAEPERLRPLVEGGALVQVTAASLDGRLGSRARRAADRLLKLGLVHVIASDAHDAGDRRLGLRRAVEGLADPSLGAWLTVDVPAAILAGGPPAPRPQTSPRKRLWGILHPGRS